MFTFCMNYAVKGKTSGKMLLILKNNVPFVCEKFI